MRETYEPIIARVNGYATGGGNHLHYMCDFGVAAEHAVFGQNGPRVGSPAEGWVVSYLCRIIGHRRAREMWFWESGEQQEGAKAFLEKRKPGWSTFPAVAERNR